MTGVDILVATFHAARGIWQQALRGGAMEGPIPELPRDQLVWRPAPGSHSIGRLLWHIGDTDEMWLRQFILQEEYKPRFGKSAFADSDDASIPSWGDLMNYLEETRARLLEALPGVQDRLSEERDFFGRTMTLGAILALGAAHEASHGGQIAHIAGVLRRGGW